MLLAASMKLLDLAKTAGCSAQALTLHVIRHLSALGGRRDVAFSPLSSLKAAQVSAEAFTVLCREAGGDQELVL